MNQVKIPKKVYIESFDTGYSSDHGPFRSFELHSEGTTLEELFKNAVIFEIDQDGGSYADHPLSSYKSAIVDDCESHMRDEFNQWIEMKDAYQLWQGGINATYESKREGGDL